MKLSSHGQSMIYLGGDNKKIIVDPLVPDNPRCDLNVETVQVDCIILTYGRSNRFGNVVELTKKTGAAIIGNAEMADCLFSYYDIENVHSVDIGGRANFDLGSVKFIQAFHSSSLTHENDTPVCLGISVDTMFEIERRTTYYTGNTGLFGDISLITKRHPVNIYFIPTGNNLTVGVNDANYAISEFIKPKISVPIYYDTSPLIEQDPQQSRDAVNVGGV